MNTTTRFPTTRRSGWWPTILIVSVVVLTFKYNPLQFVMEAGPSAYYQARVALLQGGPGEQYEVSQSLSDGKITQREYSVAVFPAFLRSIPSGAPVFPPSEAGKTLEQQRNETLEMARIRSGQAVAPQRQ